MKDLRELLEEIAGVVQQQSDKDTIDGLRLWAHEMLASRHMDEFNEIVKTEIQPYARKVLTKGAERAKRKGTPSAVVEDVSKSIEERVISKVPLTRDDLVYLLEEWEYKKSMTPNRLHVHSDVKAHLN